MWRRKIISHIGNPRWWVKPGEKKKRPSANIPVSTGPATPGVSAASSAQWRHPVPSVLAAAAATVFA